MGEISIQVKVLQNGGPVLFTWWNSDIDSAEGCLLTCTCQNWGLTEGTHSATNKAQSGKGGRLREKGNASLREDPAFSLCKALEQAEIVSLRSGVNGKSVLEKESYFGSQYGRDQGGDIEAISEENSGSNVSEGNGNSRIETGTGAPGTGTIETGRQNFGADANSLGKEKVLRQGWKMKEAEGVKVALEDEEQKCKLKSQVQSTKLPQSESRFGTIAGKKSQQVLTEKPSEDILDKCEGSLECVPQSDSESRHVEDSVRVSDLRNSDAVPGVVGRGKDQQLTANDRISPSEDRAMSHDNVQSSVVDSEGISNGTVVVVSNENEISDVDNLFRVLKGFMEGDVPQEETNEDVNLNFEEPSALLAHGTAMTYEKQQRLLYLKKLHEQPKNRSVEKTICEICGAVSSTLTIRKHLATCHSRGKRERRYVCKTCGQKFFRCEHLNRHNRLHSDPAFHCQQCGRSFRQAYQLKTHTKTHLGYKEPTRLLRRQADTRKSEDVKGVGMNKFVLCTKCGLKLDCGSIGEHLEREHGIHPPSFKCSHCGKQLSNSSSLKIHELGHSGLTYLCGFCGVALDSNKDRLRHEKLIHAEDISRRGKPVFKCGYCVKEYTRQTDRVRHEMTHLDETIDSRHLRSAKGDSPVLVDCVICGKTLRQQSMRNHLLSHNHKSWTCRICKKTLTYSYRYQHAKLHEENKRHACQHCPAKFHSKSALVVHVRKHTKEKPIPCRYCEQTFSRHGARNNHERLHTGERPYGCDLCQKAWRDRPTYMQHMRKHHPGVPMMKWRKPNHQEEERNDEAEDGPLEDVPPTESALSDIPVEVITLSYDTPAEQS